VYVLCSSAVLLSSQCVHVVLRGFLNLELILALVVLLHFLLVGVILHGHIEN
jgi:hypothetical protein